MAKLEDSIQTMTGTSIDREIEQLSVLLLHDVERDKTLTKLAELQVIRNGKLLRESKVKRKRTLLRFENRQTLLTG